MARRFWERLESHRVARKAADHLPNPAVLGAAAALALSVAVLAVLPDRARTDPPQLPILPAVPLPGTTAERNAAQTAIDRTRERCGPILADMHDPGIPDLVVGENSLNTACVLIARAELVLKLMGGVLASGSAGLLGTLAWLLLFPLRRRFALALGSKNRVSWQ